MKKVLFTVLFMGVVFGGRAQTYWETDGNSAPCLSPELVLGTSYVHPGLGCINGQFNPDFNIIHSGETMARFENNLVILGPDEDHKVLIGDPQTISLPGYYKLYVEMGIMTEKVKVALHTTADWSDYVFKDDYDLMSLKEVEVFIDKYGHLPNIPSAEELVKNGMDLGAMQAKQMAKIEELTLHLIQKDREIEALQKQVALLSKQMKQLLEKE